MLDLIDSIVADSESQAPVQVDIKAKFIEFSQSNLKELSFDWLLGASNVPGSKRVFTGGGTGEVNGSDYPFKNPDGSPLGGTPVTGGNRSGSRAQITGAIDSLLSPGSKINPAAFSIAGALTDPQFQLVVRALNQRKDVDLLSSPSILARDGEAATIDIVREFRYPTDFSPPQIPTQIGGTSNGNNLGGIPSFIPITPSTPSAWEKRDTGVTLKVTPSIKGDNYAIDLDLKPEVTEFDGFINYGSPIMNGDKVKFIYMKLPNPIRENVFSTPGELPSELGLDKYIDYDLQFEKAFIDPIKSILNVIDWDLEERSSLDQFWS
jgi:general secretion pathway protein D